MFAPSGLGPRGVSALGLFVFFFFFFLQIGGWTRLVIWLGDGSIEKGVRRGGGLLGDFVDGGKLFLGVMEGGRGGSRWV